jgi:tetrahydromethanopterin S-methyltransferase subunit G
VELQSIKDELDKVNEKLDTVIGNQHSLELKMTKRVDRNTFICNGLLWFIGVIVAAGIVALYRVALL